MRRDKTERFASASEMREALLAAAGASVASETSATTTAATPPSAPAATRPGAAARTAASTTDPTNAPRLPPTLSARAAPAGAPPALAAPPTRAPGTPARRARRASWMPLVLLLGGGGIVLIGLLALLVTGVATTLMSELHALEASQAQTATPVVPDELTARLTADLAEARALRAAGRRRESGEKLMNVVNTAQNAGVGRLHPAAPVAAAARLALAAALVDHLGAAPPDLACARRLRGARVALGLAHDQIAAADGLVGTSGDLCGLAEVAEAEVAASRVPVPSADPAPGDCAAGSRELLLDARLLGARAVTAGDARCADALAQAQSRATGDLSALDLAAAAAAPAGAPAR